MRKGEKMSSTKKQIENLALKYEQINQKKKDFDNELSEIKEELKSLLRKQKSDLVEVDEKAQKPLRIQIVNKTSIIYDEDKLKTILKPKGKDIFKKAFKVVLDTNGLEDLYNNGDVTVDEIRSTIDTTKTSSYIMVKRVKRDKIK
jgi:hypothetical protein